VNVDEVDDRTLDFAHARAAGPAGSKVLTDLHLSQERQFSIGRPQKVSFVDVKGFLWHGVTGRHG
jgi:hypothetical protein